ncbi:MAG: hypothetical protein EXX96DRAFT_533778 [Benjaminiella poitrasii]|nr:MAG: hypothetical protein EXX96DRAFT_533778 [Benjaminiella poitrasii]
MKLIRKLDENIISKIAAGEIIQHPYNAVKELIENSLDAGAKHISITISSEVLEVIKIKDDGCGIQLEDLPLACMQYATSKAKQYQDLQKLSTFGFRGEALASISNIANVTIITKTNNQACAYQGKQRASYKNGKLSQEAKPCAGNKGTIITVRNLFQNVPTRSKALIDSNKEYQHIIDYVQKYAVHFFNIGFTLAKSHSNTNDVSKCPTKDQIESIRHLYGSIIASHLKLIEYEDEYCSFKLYFDINYESLQAKRRQTLSMIFVNNRLVDNNKIKNKINQTYKAVSDDCYKPSFIYFDLTVNPSHVDINIHPTKNQVHLLNEDKIADAVSKALRNSLTELFTTSKSKRKPKEGTIMQYFKPTLQQRHQQQKHTTIYTDIKADDNESSTSSNSVDTPPLSLSADLLKNGDFIPKDYFRNVLFQEEMKGNVTTKSTTLHNGSQQLSSFYKSYDIDAKSSLLSSFSYNAVAMSSPVKEYHYSNSRTVNKSSIDKKLNTVTESNSKRVSITENQNTLCPKMSTFDQTPHFNDNHLYEDLDSIHLLQQEIKNSENKKLSKLLRGYTTLGFLHDFILLAAFKNTYYMINYPLISEEFFYQLMVNQFARFGKLNLSEPISIQDCLSLVTKADTSTMTNHLLSQKDLLEAYFKTKISKDDQNNVRLESLPMLLQNYTPSFDKIPIFLLKISTEVNWEDELECLDALMHEFAFLYCCCNQDSWEWIKQTPTFSEFKAPKYLVNQGYILEFDIPEEIL